MNRIFSHSIPVSRVILGAIFAKGVYRKNQHLNATEHTRDTCDYAPLSPFDRSVILLSGGFNHIWLFPYHTYCDHFGATSAFHSKKNPLYILYK